jgi:hypothetical protein
VGVHQHDAIPIRQLLLEQPGQRGVIGSVEFIAQPPHLFRAGRFPEDRLALKRLERDQPGLETTRVERATVGRPVQVGHETAVDGVNRRDTEPRQEIVEVVKMPVGHRLTGHLFGHQSAGRALGQQRPRVGDTHDQRERRHGRAPDYERRGLDAHNSLRSRVMTSV